MVLPLPRFCHRARTSNAGGAPLLVTCGSGNGSLVLSAALPLLTLALLANSAAAAEDAIQVPHLFWRNGDVLPGSLHRATERELAWTATMFTEPLRVKLDALHMIRFPIGDPTRNAIDPSGAQTIETRDGNRFYGTIKSATDRTLVVDTFQHGELRIRREALGLIANATSRAHVYSGPKGLRGWSTVTYGRRLSEWQELPGGRLTTRMVAAELHRALPANGSVDIDVEFLWRSNPSFQIRFLTPFAKQTKETVKLETRANNYVIQTLGSNGRFRQLDSIPKDQTKCRFLLRWSQSSSQLSIYRGRKYLGKINVKQKDTKTGPAGIYIKNTGPQLTLSRLEIRAGSTLDMTDANPQLDTVLRSDNVSLSGAVAELTGDALVLEDERRESTRLLWSDISEVRFRVNDEDLPLSKDGVECVFQNGETIRGHVLRADAHQFTLRVPSVENPVICVLNDLERIVLHSRTMPPSKRTPTISFGTRKLHGHLRPTPSGHLGWQPLDGPAAAAIADDQPIRVDLEPMVSQEVGSVDDDLLYLRSGDVIPCQVRSATAEAVMLTSRFSQDAALPHAAVKAVELAGSPIPPVVDFDQHWLVEHAKHAVFTDARTKLTFRQPTSVKHDSVLAGNDQIQFRLHRQQFEKLGSFFQVSLHSDDDKTRTVPFYFSGKKSFVMGTLGAAFKPIPQDKGTFEVRIQTFPFEVWVNGRSMGVSSKTLRADRNTKWVGVSFTLGQGQAPGLAGFRRFPKGQIVLDVTDLQISRVRRQAISHAATVMDTVPLLTAPRNRDRHELTHLAVGTNNDVVRGKLLELDAENVQMVSKHSPRHLPRSALSGLIWLGNGEAVAEPTEALTRIVLRDTTTVAITKPRITETHLEGQHLLLGPFRIALEEIQTVLIGSVPNQYHRHPFLRWQLVEAKQPQFDVLNDTGAELIGQQPKLDLDRLGSTKKIRISDYNGRVVVLEFWATWCAPCIKNMPRVLETMKQFSPIDVGFVAVNQGEPPEIVQQMVTAKGWDMVTALDPQQHATTEFNVGSLPQTVVLDQTGRITAVFTGAESDLPGRLKAAIDDLLKDQP